MLDKLDIAIEVFFTICIVTNAFLFIPQIIRLFKAKRSHDTSLITFAGFNIINIFYVLHGLINHDKLLIFGSTLSVITNTSVTYLIIYYRAKPYWNKEIKHK